MSSEPVAPAIGALHSPRRRHLLFIAAAVVGAGALAGGIALYQHAETAAPRDGSAVLALVLPDVDGRQQPLSQWRGKVLVVNFWATWCAPCREEIPILVTLQEKYRARGLQLVGIAIDQRDKVEAFAREFKINYALLLGGLETINVSRQIGNRLGALPYTAVLDRSGRIVSRQLGKVTDTELERLVLLLL